MEIILDDTYMGPFEAVGVDVIGNPIFESAQQGSGVEVFNNLLSDIGVERTKADEPAELEVNFVNWSVDENDVLSGRAKFLTVRSNDVIYATLSGKSPKPEAGSEYRMAYVDVKFTGGSGIFSSSRGKAKVVAKLMDDGMSVGHIQGAIEIDIESI